jgi:hypothetical protein
MKGLIFYRIITFILLPVAVILGVLDLMAFLTALANPILLLPVFILACVVIYTFASFTFFNRVAANSAYYKKSLRDLVRVNGIVSLVFCFYTIFAYLTFAAKPGMINDAINMSLSMQKQPLPANVTKEALGKIMMSLLSLFAAYTVLLGIHIFMSLKLLKHQKAHFDTQE